MNSTLIHTLMLFLILADVVRDDDPSNNVPDSIFSKLGMQLHRRDKHPIGIIKNAIYDYFDSNYAKKFDKIEDLSPIVTTKQVSYFSITLRLLEKNHLLRCKFSLFRTRTLMMC